MRYRREMQASLTLFAKRLFTSRSFLFPTALAIVSIVLSACGSGDEPDEVVQIDTTEPQAASSEQSSRTEATRQQPTSPPAATTAPTIAPDPTVTLVPTIAPTETPEPTPEPPYWTQIGIRDAIEQYPPLNERTDYALRNNQEWLNGEPTSIKELQDAGQIVLIDFWTYT